MTKPFVISKRLVWEAFQRVKANGGSAGVDQESIEEFESKLGDNLYKLWNRLGSGSYFPPPVKAVPIPKKSGGHTDIGRADGHRSSRTDGGQDSPRATTRASVRS